MRKYNFIDIDGSVFEPENGKYYKRTASGIVEITESEIDTLDSTELVFSGSKADIRKGEMLERNLTVLENNAEDLGVSNSTVSGTIATATGDISTFEFIASQGQTDFINNQIDLTDKDVKVYLNGRRLYSEDFTEIDNGIRLSERNLADNIIIDIYNYTTEIIEVEQTTIIEKEVENIVGSILLGTEDVNGVAMINRLSNSSKTLTQEETQSNWTKYQVTAENFSDTLVNVIDSKPSNMSGGVNYTWDGRIWTSTGQFATTLWDITSAGISGKVYVDVTLESTETTYDVTHGCSFGIQRTPTKFGNYHYGTSSNGNGAFALSFKFDITEIGVTKRVMIDTDTAELYVDGTLFGVLEGTGDIYFGVWDNASAQKGSLAIDFITDETIKIPKKVTVNGVEQVVENTYDDIVPYITWETVGGYTNSGMYTDTLNDSLTSDVYMRMPTGNVLNITSNIPFKIVGTINSPQSNVIEIYLDGVSIPFNMTGDLFEVPAGEHTIELKVDTYSNYIPNFESSNIVPLIKTTFTPHSVDTNSLTFTVDGSANQLITKLWV